MALKFRRGTTAQKSGSLAFGEPYVNTTLGTLQIGGPDGDITLGSTGTGSTGTFGAISGSGLDITGNANIAGNLTLGGQLTIGDNTSDTVNVVASLSSSLIPQTDNTFDLGSATKSWRDLYISTGSIKIVSGGTVLTTLSTNGDGSQNFPNGIYANGNSGYIQSDAGLRIKQGSQTSETGYLGIGADFDRVVLSTSGGAYAQHLIFPNNGIRLYTYPATDGTLALTSDTTANSASAASVFASASAYSASAAVVAITNANSAAGAFASASAYSASAAVVAITNANSAAGAFASASAYSASAATTYAQLAVANTFTANQIVSGSITATGDVVAFSTSDRRHKNNIVLISDALSKVNKLNGVTWEWNEDVDSATKETPKTGLIAQEVQEVLPEVVKERQDGFLALDYSKMMGLMVEAIKEQQTQIHSLTLEIEKLKKDNSL
jgi:hypothetical protein